MIDSEAVLGKLLDIPVRQAIPQVPADCDRDPSRRNRKPGTLTTFTPTPSKQSPVRRDRSTQRRHCDYDYEEAMRCHRAEEAGARRGVPR